MVDGFEDEIKREVASIIDSLERAEARFELASFAPQSDNSEASDRAIAEVRNALEAARLVATALGGVAKPVRH